MPERTMNGETEMTHGALLLAVMKQLEQLTDDELRTVVHSKVTSAADRKSYERLSENVSHDTLLLLSARALAQQLMLVRRQRAE